MDPYVSNIKALTCSDNQGGHKLHSYKACNWLQNLNVLVEFVKNHIRQMVRPQLPFCIPFKNDSQRFQRITSNIIFSAASYKNRLSVQQVTKFLKVQIHIKFQIRRLKYAEEYLKWLNNSSQLGSSQFTWHWILLITVFLFYL